MVVVQLAHRNLSFVQHKPFEDATKYIKNLLDMVPVEQGREFLFPALIGPMGIGKTRSCEEICKAVKEYCQDNGKLLQIVKVNIKDFSRVMVVSQDYLQILAQAILYGLFPQISRKVLKNVQFDDVANRVKETGAEKVLLYLDEIQVDRNLVKTLYQACDKSMRNGGLKLAVVPLSSGLTGPTFETLPSGAIMSAIMMEPLQLNDESLHRSICAAINVPEDSLSTCPNLHALFYLCEGRPSFIDIVVKSINKQRSSLTLPNILVNEAESIFVSAVENVSNTYGIHRWHALFGGVGTSNEESIRKRDSFEHVTARLIRRLLLDAFVDRKIVDLAIPIVQPFTDPDLKHLQHRFPTYQSCVDSGLFTMTDNIVRIPLIGLLVMDKIVNVLPHKSLNSPFDPNWGTMEVVGMAAIYLRLLSASNLGIQKMKLKDLRPGADWNGCDDVEVIVPAEDQLRFVSLGAKIVEGATVIKVGSDGLGHSLELSPGLVAIAFQNQPGWDGFTFLEADVGGIPPKRSLIIATQVKHRETNIGNGIESLTKLGNATFKRILKTQMEPVFKALANIFVESLTEDTVYVFDVFSDHLEPSDARRGLESVVERYCLTRMSAFNQVTGTPLSRICNKRVKVSPK